MKLFNLVVLTPLMVFTLWNSNGEDADVITNSSSIETSIEKNSIYESEEFATGACIGYVGEDLVVVTVECWWCSGVGANRRACDKLKEMQDAANASLNP